MESYKTMPKVSVIIPSYNHEHYIRRTVESVINQTFDDIECIVVDDGSTDSTEEILRPYIEKKQIKFIAQKNQGVSVARNRGIKEATGKYIKFCDSDDYIYRWQVDIQVDQLEQEEDNIISMTGREVTFENGVKKTLYPKVPKTDQLAAYVIHNRGGVHTLLIPRNLLIQVGGFDESIRGAEDLDCWMRLIMAGAVVKPVEYVGCSYSILDTSKSTNSKSMFLDKSKVFEKLNKRLLEQNEPLSIALKKALLWRNKWHIQQCFARNESLEEFFPKALKMIEKISFEQAGIQAKLIKWLGVKFYLRLTYQKNILTNSSFKEKLVDEENLWKERLKRMK